MSPSTVDQTPVLPPGPRCGGTHIVRNGVNESGSQVHLGRACGRRFVAHPKKGPITPAEQDRIRRLRAERRGIRAIARATGVSRAWVQGFVNRARRDEAPVDPEHPGPPPKRRAGW